MNTVGMGGRVYGVEQITTKSGASMVKFRLQSARYKKDAFYIDVITFDKSADFISQHVKDGSGVFVSGKLDEDAWEKDGVKQRRLKIVADRVEFLPTTPKKDKGTSPEAEAESGPEAGESAPESSDDKTDF